MDRFAPHLLSFLVFLAAGFASGGVALGGYVGDYAVFGGQGVSIGGSSTVDGIVASNGNVAVDVFSMFEGLTGGGSLGTPTKASTDFTVNGPVTFNGGVYTSGATFNGAINSGGAVNVDGSSTESITATGSVSTGHATVNGNVATAGDFTDTSGGIVNGDVAANGKATVGGAIHGNVTYGTSLAVVGFGSISGSTTQGTTTVIPSSYTQTSIPPAHSFTAGGPDVTSGGSASTPLAPGTYGALNIERFAELYLTSGNYYFTSINFLGDAINFLNVGPKSHVNIFVTGDVFESDFARVTVNGASYSNADSSLASDILLETHGNYSSNGANSFFGTISAPDGNVTLGNSYNLTGQVVAGGQFTTGDFFDQVFVPSAMFAVPEPKAIHMTTIGAGLILVVLRLRRAACRRS
jgi:hypothetical protein